MRYQSEPKELGGQPKLEEVGKSRSESSRTDYSTTINSGLGQLHEVRILKRIF